MDDPIAVEAVRTALSEAVGTLWRRYPDLRLEQICEALGAVAGIAVGVTLPTADEQADETMMGHLGLGFSDALAATIQARMN